MDTFKTKNVNNGKYEVSIIENDMYIGRCIENGFEWDGWMREDAYRYYKPGTDILDVGGNIGYNALMFSDYGPVHTFEPVFHSVIEKNIKQNNLKHTIELYPFGLSSKSDTVRIFLPKLEHETYRNYGGCSISESQPSHCCEIFKNIEVKKLDDVYSGKPSIIKVDIEGHEEEFLKGAKETITKYHPTIFIEIHNFSDENPVVQLLWSYGYKCSMSRPEWVYIFT